MLGKMRCVSALGAVVAVTTGCGYPSFQFGPGGSGGATTTTSSSETSSSSGGATTTSSTLSATHTTTTASGPPVCPDHVVISQIRTRGVNGGTDEFVELYNPTGQQVVLDPEWTIFSRSQTDLVDYQRWQGNGGILPAHGFFLVVGSGYAQSPAPDDVLASGISDAGRVQLIQSPDIFTNNLIDSVCFAFDGTSSALVSILGCTPATNPHGDTTSSDFDRSIERAPRDCTETGNDSVDFVAASPSTPKDSQSPPVTY